MAKKSETTLAVNQIETAIYKEIKQYGFKKHGRVLCRFVDSEADIAQIISFQLGQAYCDETHLLVVNVAIRVPECFEQNFIDYIEKKPYYHEYHATIRSMLGKIDGKEYRAFDLQGESIKDVEKEILYDIVYKVLPVFDILSSREAILVHRNEYPNFDKTNGHLAKLEEVFIYGYLGNIEMANKLFAEYYTDVVRKRDIAIDKHQYMRYELHRQRIEKTAKKNNLSVP